MVPSYKFYMDSSMTNLDSVLKSRDITLPTKVYIVKAIIFPVIMYRCESWTLKKAKHRRINAFELWFWRSLLRVPWTAGRSNQSILKEINPEYYWKDWCWSWSSSSLATWCEEPTHWERPWCWERVKAGGRQKDREAWHAAVHGSQRFRHDWATEQQWQWEGNIDEEGWSVLLTSAQKTF